MFGDFTLISGPCLLEDHGLNLEIARELVHVSRQRSLPVIFKASFDKANRSRPEAARGPGLAAGLGALARVKEDTDLPVLTDIHEPAQASAAAEVVDVLQIPAFLCRQSDLIIAAGRTGKPVNIKKGQWVAPEDMAGSVDKALRAGAPEVAVTERGTFLGYGDLVVDMRAFPRVARACGVPVIFDGTHSVQRPGRMNGSSGGDPEFVPSLVRAAVAAGCDGLFLEVHPDPASAPSDGSNMLPLAQLGALLDDVLAIRGVVAASSSRDEP
jgi:2-dehydro-3-deoxyphosphooctonate aldolase (KDO 8-P synthase)